MNPEAIRTSVKEAMKEAFRAAIDTNETFDYLDELINDYLTRADCFIDFDAQGARCLVGVGPGDAAFEIRPEIVGTNDYPSIRSEAVYEDVQNRIRGFDKFIAELGRDRQHYQRILDAYHP